MKRMLFIGTALGMLALLILPDVANAQRRGGGGRGGESSRGWGGGGWGGEGWGGGGWNRGWGGGYGYGGFGYGYPGYYGSRYYGGYSYPYSYGNYGYGYQPYSYDSGYQPYYTYDQNSSPNYDYTNTDQGSIDGSSMGRSNNNAVSLRVIVPDANAKVWVEGQETRQRGTDRLFISPPLERGKSYNYTVKVQFNQDGREVTREKTVPVQAGKQAVANFGQGGDMDRRMRTGTQLDQTEEFDRTRDNRRQLDNQPNRTRENRNLEHPNASDRTRTGAHRQFDAAHPFMGKVVNVNDDQVTVSDAQGNEHTFRIPASADVMVQGNKGSASSLKAGMQVTITPESDNMGVASKIEATSQDRKQDTNRSNTKPSANRPPE